MTTDTRFRARQYAGEGDLQPISDLIRVCEAIDKSEDTRSVEDLRRHMHNPDIDVPRNIRLWDDESGRLIGYSSMAVLISENGFDIWLNVKTLPEIRGDGLDDAQMRWNIARATEIAHEAGKTAVLRIEGRETSIYHRELAARHDFAPERYFIQMARPSSLPIPSPQFPDGLRLAHTNGAADVEKWVEMFNAAWLDHWGYHPLTVERRRYRLSDPDYKPEYDLVGVADDGTFAGFCFCMIHHDDNRRNNHNEGWIHLLGTRRGYRKIGLGKALLLAGLELLRREGVEMARLDVDADSPSGAVGLYEAVGFVNIATDVLYARTVS